MPKATFFNLSEEKRDRIMTAAIDEFSKYDYNEVTVSKIVKEAGIPKGSFYQYFEDKFDLFFHIITLVGETKKSYFMPMFANMGQASFFDSLSEMYKAGIKFSMEHPKEANIGSLLLKSSDKTLLKRIYGDMEGQVEGFLGPFLQTAIDSGELRDDIDTSFLSYIFGQFNMVFADYFFNIKGGSDFSVYAKDIDVMLDLFKNGVIKR
jgi:AcrR family transcriptional regulator